MNRNMDRKIWEWKKDMKEDDTEVIIVKLVTEKEKKEGMRRK